MARKNRRFSNKRLKKKMNPVNAAVLVILLIFIVASVQTIRILVGYMQADAAYSEIAGSMRSISMTIFTADGTTVSENTAAADAGTESESSSESEETAAAVSYTYEITIPDFAYLSSVNSDVIGWIQIPGTAVNYPIVQGSDNEYYLTHLYTGVSNSNGAIFLDSSTTDQLQDKNAIIFGHNMKDGSMFATLNNYSSSYYYSLHPYIVVTDLNGTRYIYDIFSVYTVDSTDEAACDAVYLHGFGADSVFADYLETVRGMSLYDTGINADQNDYIITLSTCTSSNSTVRTIVQAVRR